MILEKPEVLHCTPNGQVGENKPATIFSITREQGKRMSAARKPLSGDALRRALTAALNLPARDAAPDYRILRPSSGRNYPKRFAATYAVETEPEIHALVYRLNETALTSRPPRGSKRAVLYVAHRSADAELRTESLIKEVIAAEPEAPIFACDLRGVGESHPLVSNRDPNSYYGAPYFHAACGLMFGYAVPGQQTHDVLRVIDWLRDNGHDDIHVLARGYGAIPAAFAAVLHDAVTQVTLKHALTSYETIVDHADYGWPLPPLVPGVLKSFDLPDCYRELARKKLKQIEPVGAGGVPA